MRKVNMINETIGLKVCMTPEEMRIKYISEYNDNNSKSNNKNAIKSNTIKSNNNNTIYTDTVKSNNDNKYNINKTKQLSSNPARSPTIRESFSPPDMNLLNLTLPFLDKNTFQLYIMDYDSLTPNFIL